MPIQFDLETIRKKHNCKNYVETGMWHPRDETISLRKAMKSNFDKIYCIEIRDDFL